MAAEKPKQQVLGDVSCPSDQVLKHDGTLWVCAPDNDSPTTALDWNAITNRPAGLDDGDDDNDALAGLDCAAGDVARFDGSEWVCSDAVSRLELFQFGKRVFISSVFFDGNFGGLDGADAACQELSVSAGLPGKYRAWLSDSTGSPATRFTQSATPYILVDGTVIADNWADLVDGQLNDAIYLQEDGLPSPMVASLFGQVRTATNEAGTLNTAAGPDFHCDNWSTSSGEVRGLVGSPNSAGTPSESTEIIVSGNLLRLGWTRYQTEVTPGSGLFGEVIQSCELAFPIYCFQQ